MVTSGRGVPEGASPVIPRLVCREPAAEMDFCVRAFDAAELARRPGPDGSLAHGLITIGPAMLMIEAEWPGVPSRAPLPDGSSPVALYVYVPDVEQTLTRAVAGGARVLVEPTDQFWGDRTAWIVDPQGHVWTVASRIEETSEEERAARWERIRGVVPRE